MFTSQKIGRTVFVSLYFDKIVYYANAMDGMYVNAHKKWPSHKFLVCTSLLFNKNIPQVAARAPRLQWLKIEQKHRMTSSTWFRGCRTKWVIGHRTWSIIGHSTIYIYQHLLFPWPRLMFSCHTHLQVPGDQRFLLFRSHAVNSRNITIACSHDDREHSAEKQDEMLGLGHFCTKCGSTGPGIPWTMNEWNMLLARVYWIEAHHAHWADQGDSPAEMRQWIKKVCSSNMSNGTTNNVVGSYM